MTTFLAAIGDSNDPSTWSGIPYHILQQARKQGLIQVGLPLSVTSAGWWRRRLVWNICSVMSGRGTGGFQYSVGFLERLWRPFHELIVRHRVINCFQLFPPSIVSNANVERWYFLDQTLHQLFDQYGVRTSIGRRIADDAIDRERIGYEAAAGIVMHSRWAANSVIRDYGIDPSKVFVVVPGANIDTNAARHWSAIRETSSSGSRSSLQLVFVGKDPHRKGLDRLLRAYAIVRGQGLDCKLRIIGCTREGIAQEIGDLPGIEWLGFVDKRDDPYRYVTLVGDCDIGCLLSRAEAGGIGLREFHSLGLAVIGPDVGGSPDHVLPGAATLVSPIESDEEVATLISEFVADRDRVRLMRTLSWQNREEMSWDTSIRRLSAIMGLKCE